MNLCAIFFLRFRQHYCRSIACGMPRLDVGGCNWPIFMATHFFPTIAASAIGHDSITFICIERRLETIDPRQLDASI